MSTHITAMPTTTVLAIIGVFELRDDGNELADGDCMVGEVPDALAGGCTTAVVFPQLAAVFSSSTETRSLLEVGFACQIVKLFAS